MINSSLIQPRAPIVCSDNAQIALVDQVENADTIRLAKDVKGQHHYIPMKWVTSVDDKVHIDRTGGQAMREWSSTPTNAKAVTPTTDAKSTPKSV
jgi:hypothetical protein